MSSIYDLNGEWDIVFDTTNVGVDQRWYANPPETEQTSQVPQTWEKEFGKFPGSIAFYFRRFEVDDTFNAKRTFLRFLGSSYFTTVWLNGKLLGENHGSFHSFDINVAKALKTDEENLLCVRVASVAANRVEGTLISDLPVGTDFKEIPFGGLWRGVELINGGKSCILNSNVTPDVDSGKIEIELSFSNPRNHSTRLLFVVETPDGSMCRIDKEVKLEKEDSTIKVPLQLKEWEKWELDDPKLYKLEIFMEKTFSVSHQFGFRKIDIYRSDIYFNDAPLKIQGMVYTTTHPVQGTIMDDEKVIRKDLTTIKEMGFNAIRSGGYPLGGLALSICDELGLMVFQDLPIQNQRSSKEGLEISRDVIEHLVRQQKTHPSLAVWVLGSDNGTLLLENGTKLLKHVDLFDDTRPVVSNMNNMFVSTSGDLEVDTGKVIGVTNDKVILYNSHRVQAPLILNSDESTLFANYMVEGTENAVTERVSFPENFGQTYNDILGQTSVVKATLQIDLPTMATDFATLPKKYTTAARNLNHGKRVNAASKSWATVVNKALTESLWKSEESFRADFNEFRLGRAMELVNTAMSSIQVSGYFLSRYRDVAQHFEGLFDEFHREKTDLSLIADYTKPNRVLLTGLEGSVEPGVEFCPRLRLLNVNRVGEITLAVSIEEKDGGKSLAQFEGKFETVGSVYTFEGVQLKTPSNEGEYTVIAKVLKSGKVLNEAESSLLVKENKEVKEKGFTILKSVSHKALESALNKSDSLVIQDLSGIDEKTLLALVGWVNEGRKVAFVRLNAEELKRIVSVGLLPECEMVESSGAFRFFSREGVGISGIDQKYVNQYYSEVLPKESLSLEFSEDFLGSALELDEVGADWVCDLVAHPLGGGTVWVNQYDVLNGSAVANELLANLVKQF